MVLLLVLLLTADDDVVDSIGSYQYRTTKNGVNVRVIQNQLLPGDGAVVTSICMIARQGKRESYRTHIVDRQREWEH